MAGALLFACLGVATQYFVYLCNGLSYANGPLKSCAMAASLAVLAFGAAAGGVRYPRYSCEWRAGMDVCARMGGSDVWVYWRRSRGCRPPHG